MLIPFLLVLFGAPTKNPADCAVLNAGLKMACEREIRAGRSFEIPPAPSDAATWSQEAPQLDPVQVQAKLATPEERTAAAAERTARATETMATIMVVSLCLTVVSMVVLLVAVK